MPLSRGDRLGPYEILARIGAGGMGEVWQARDTRLDRVVAIKQLKVQHGARFEQEARAIAALNHPHICQIFDVGPDYLVLEFVSGEPLRGPLAEGEAVRLGIQIAGALEAAHESGILHRDLKPDNVLVTKNGAKLLDFGLAKLDGGAAADVTQTGEGVVLGTAPYMSPEQARAKALDARSDIFSFGAVLSKEPGQRFQSAAEVRRALEGLSAAPMPSTLSPSIAVLPFANLSGDREQEYFSDGLTEEIINALTRSPGLKVIARTSAFAFKGQNTDVRKIAEVLGVAHVIEGSVRRAGSRIRVTAQLIAAADGSNLWSERYDRQMDDVFAVQDEIAAAIAGMLEAKLASSALKRVPSNVAAHEALLKARYFMYQHRAESMMQAETYFQQAIALDPAYATAHAAYAEYLFQRVQVGMVPAHEGMPRMRAEARKALELDRSLAEAHAMLEWRHSTSTTGRRRSGGTSRLWRLRRWRHGAGRSARCGCCG